MRRKDEEGNIKSCGAIYMHISCSKCDKAIIAVVDEHLA